MSHTKLVMLAGAAMGLGGVALAGQSWSSNNADEVRALVAEMMNDAQTRSSLLQSGNTAGHDGKFFLGSADGNFKLNVGGQIQFRYIYNFRDDSEAVIGEDEDNTLGFQTRRTKLWFNGHIFDPNLYYNITGAFNRNGGSFEAEDVYVGYKFDNGMDLRWGQFKAPFTREETVNSTRQLAVERSNLNSIFSLGRVQGVQLAYDAEQFRFKGMFSDGSELFPSNGSANSDFNDDPSDFALTGRVEFLASGDWNQFDQFTSWRGSSNALMVGAALHWQDASREQGRPNNELFAYTLDISWMADGWNLYGAFVGSSVDVDGGPTVDNYGFLLQGGVFVSDDWELFGRWDMVFGDDDVFANDEYTEITLGANYYIHKHAAKFTVDLVWALDESAGAPANTSTGRGMLPSGEEDQFAIRAQFQLVF